MKIDDILEISFSLKTVPSESTQTTYKYLKFAWRKHGPCLFKSHIHVGEIDTQYGEYGNRCDALMHTIFIDYVKNSLFTPLSGAHTLEERKG